MTSQYDLDHAAGLVPEGFKPSTGVITTQSTSKKTRCPGSNQPTVAKEFALHSMTYKVCAHCGAYFHQLKNVGDLAPRHFRGTIARG